MVDQAKHASRRAKEAVAERFGSDIDGLRNTDVTGALRWPQVYRIFTVSDLKDVNTVVAVPEQGDTLVFDPKDNLDLLNRIFETEDIALPDGLPGTYFAQAIRGFCRGFRGVVGSTEFLASEASSKHQWLRDPSDEARFDQYCSDPALLTKDDSWIFEFWFFNELGGIEHWRAEGNAAKIDRVLCTQAAPNNTFRFPYV